MNRVLRSLIAMLMALAMLAPAALAEEEGWLSTVELSNFTVQIGEEEPMEADAVLRMSAGTDADRWILKFGADVLGDPVVAGTAAYEDDSLKLAATGLSSAYEITGSQIKGLFDQMKQETASAGAAFDMEAYLEMIRLYPEMIKQAEALEAAGPAQMQEMERAILSELKDLEESDEPEEVQVLGETLSLERAHFTMDGQALWRVMDKTVDEMGGAYQAYFDAYFRFLNSGLGGEQEVRNFSDLMQWTQRQGGEPLMDVTIWSDDEGKDVRAEITMTVTAAAVEEGQTRETTLPMVVEARDVDGVQQIAIQMQMEDEEVGMSMLINTVEEPSRQALDLAMSLMLKENEAASSPATEVSYKINADTRQEGGNETVVAGIELGVMGQTMGASFNYAGTVSERNERFGRLNARFFAPMGPDEANSSVFGCDIRTSEAPLTDADFEDVNALGTVDLLNIDEAQQKIVEREGKTLVIRMVGAALSLEPVARMVSDMATLAQESYMMYEGMQDDYGQEYGQYDGQYGV